MDMEQQKKSRWPFRILIASLVSLVIGSVLLLSQMDTMDEILDPRDNNVSELNTQSEVQKLVEIDDTGCYRAYGTGFDGNVTLYDLDGYDNGEPITESKCKLDWQAMASDGQEFDTLGTWIVSAKGDYILQVECDGECENETIWLTSIDSMEDEVLSSTSLLTGAMMCCLGVLLLPLSGVLLAFSQNRKKNVMVVMGPDGNLMPLTDYTPDNIQAQLNQQKNETTDGLNFDIRTGEYVDPQKSNPQAQMGGQQHVAAGSMLTTEQVYALMRGDVEAGSTHVEEVVPDPFPTSPGSSVAASSTPKQTPLQVEKPSRKIPKAENQDWQSWDED
ncbi:hypothetical protein N9M06_01095 [Candidatus Poseidoniales archaeon]|nr:hypothetical protein [Candidatus Poseidoniales archaeon]